MFVCIVFTDSAKCKLQFVDADFDRFCSCKNSLQNGELPIITATLIYQKFKFWHCILHNARSQRLPFIFGLRLSCRFWFSTSSDTGLVLLDLHNLIKLFLCSDSCSNSCWHFNTFFTPKSVCSMKNQSLAGISSCINLSIAVSIYT